MQNVHAACIKYFHICKDVRAVCMTDLHICKKAMQRAGMICMYAKTCLLFPSMSGILPWRLLTELE